MNRHLIACALGLMLTTVTPALASSLIYTPVNPDFGGSPFNGPTLLNQAQAQNGFKDPAAISPLTSFKVPTAAELFKTQITSALLSQISTQIGNQILGENAKDSGHFSVNGLTIDFARAGGQVNVTINDGSGGVSQISIPVPQF
ncbi:MAG TPA: curli assembly protein CsgF [Acetobacteraceae bacterium]|jgi:curli production assembly/transport component CsgF|nr:curli assembly protein CsgF [Acetobacteraceae bacterium]